MLPHFGTVCNAHLTSSQNGTIITSMPTNSLPYALHDVSTPEARVNTYRDIAAGYEELADARRVELEAKSTALEMAFKALGNATAALDAASDELFAARAKARAIMETTDPLTRGLLANALVASLLRPYEAAKKACGECDGIEAHELGCSERATFAAESGGDL